MTTPLRILRLDELEINQHFDLDSEDMCYYWRKYTAGKDYTYSDTNRLIKNFRIPISDERRVSYKIKAIDQLAREFIQLVKNDATYTNYTFIPIPTSKGRDSQDYDDRLIKLLHLVSKYKKMNMDIRELIIQSQKTPQAHTLPSKERPSVEELLNLYIIKDDLLKPTPKNIIIFDDILTKGSHFKAMKKMLQKCYPGVPIMGLFIACSSYDESIN